jgi:outer membrane protein W
MIKYIALAAVLLTGSVAVHAQQEMQLSIGYNVNIPSGAFRDYVNKPAYKGFTATLAYALSSQISVGLNVGYNDYYQKYPRQVYPGGDGSDISAVVSNSVQQFPVLLTGNYTFLKEGFVRPYAGVGAGVNFVTFDQYLGEFDNPRTTAKFDLKGEAGVYIPLSNYNSTALKIGGSYNYVPYNTDGIKTLNSWGLEAGVRFAIH